MKRPIVIVGIAAVVLAAWFFVSPLFIDSTVDEAFEFTTDSGAIDIQKVMAMSDDQRSAIKKKIMGMAARAPDQVNQEKMPEGAPQLVARGTFTDADAIHKGSGTASIYKLPRGNHAVRFENFRSTNGPALVVYLARHPSPASAVDVLERGFVSLGKLKGNVGNQNYLIPEGTNIDAYHSVVIWCELFNVLFSPAPLVSTM